MKKTLLFTILHFIFVLYIQGQMQLSYTSTVSTCQNNGSLTITAMGGGGNFYNYVLVSGPAGVSLPQATGNVFYGLPSGSYVVEVTDNNGNLSSLNASVPGNYTNPIIASVVSAPNSNLVYGTTVVTVQSGTGLAPFQYAYSPVGSPAPVSTAYQSSNIISCMPTGNHNIYLKDACGNVNVFTTYVQGSSMSCAISCNLNPTGNDVTLTISGYNQVYDGTGPFTYQIGNSGLSGTLPMTGYSTTIPFTPTCSTGSITISNACGQSQTHNINCLIGNIDCANFLNGTASLNADGGVLPYTYSYQMPSGSWLTNTTGSITGLPTNVNLYHFKVTDACGNVNRNYNSLCNHSEIYNLSPNNIYFYQNCGNLTGINYSTNSCSYDSKHFPITYTCTTCSPQITFTSSTNNGYVSISPNISGPQSFLITDACGNQITKNFTPNVPPPSSLNISKSITCNSATLSVYQTGGCYSGVPSTPTTYTLSLPSGVITNTTGIFTGLTSGTYTATASNICCATATTTVIIPNPTPFSPTWYFFPSSNIVNGVCTRSWYLILNNSYTLSGGPSNQTYGTSNGFNYLQPGTYTITASQPCFNGTQTIVLPPLPPANLTGTATAGCQGLTGTITLQGATNWAAWGATYGVTIYGNDYYRYNNTNSTTSVYNNLLTNSTHTFYLRPNYGNCNLDTLTLTVPNYAPVSITPSMGATCSNSSTASVGATTQYGVAPFTYNLFDNNQNLISTQVSNSNSVVFNNQPNGDYTIQVTDACGTIRNTDVNVNALSFTPTFKRYCDSTTTLSAPNILGATYSWTYNGNYIANSAAPIINSISGGIYSVYINVGACTFNNSITIPNFNGQVLNANAGLDSSSCNSTSGTAIFTLWADNIPSGATGYWEQLSGTGNSIFANPTQNNSVVTVSTMPGTYQYLWTLDGGTSGCIDRDTLNLVFTPIICPPFYIEEVNLSVKHTSLGNLLDWNTRNEEDNKGFYVERSFNNTLFEGISPFIQGKNLAYNEYQYLDEFLLPPSNTMYYRLKIIDNDGNVSYSPKVQITDIASPVCYIYPNPTSGEIEIITNEEDKIYQVDIYNVLGEKVSQTRYETILNQVHIDASYLAKGIYNLKVCTQNGIIFYQKLHLI